MAEAELRGGGGGVGAVWPLAQLRILAMGSQRRGYNMGDICVVFCTRGGRLVVGQEENKGTGEESETLRMLPLQQ